MMLMRCTFCRLGELPVATISGYTWAVGIVTGRLVLRTVLESIKINESVALLNIL
jgi:hypothetical protein